MDNASVMSAEAIDGAVCCIHTLYSTVVVISLMLLWLTKTGRIESSRRPSHAARIVLMLVLVAVQVFVLLRDILSAMPRASSYVASILTAVGTSAGLVYGEIVGNTRPVAVAVMLLLYWLSCTAMQLLRVIVCFLHQPSLTADVNVCLLIDTFILAVYVCLLLLECVWIVRHRQWKRTVCSSADDLSALKYVHLYVSFLSKTLIHWLNPLLFIGFRRTLCLEDLGGVPLRESTMFNFCKLKEAFEDEKRLSFRRNRAPSLWRCFWRLTRSHMIVSGLFKLVSDFLIYIPPLSVDVIVTFAETQRMNVSANSSSSSPAGVIGMQDYFSNGYVVCYVMFVALLIHAVLAQHNFLISILEGIRCKCAVQALIFDKSLRLMVTNIDEGRIVNHMTVDPVHIVMFFNVAHYAWTLPIQTTTGFLLLYHQLGKSALISSFFVLLLLPVQYLLAWRLALMHKRKMELSDRRLKISNELLQSIKLLKLYAWERFLEHSVTAARWRELCMMLHTALLRIFSVTCTDGIPYVACLLTFTLYNQLETEPLSAAKIFSSIALFSYISNQLFVITVVINIAGQARSSVARLQSFLLLPEVGASIGSSRNNNDEMQTLKPSTKHTMHSDDRSNDDRERFAVKITDGIFMWSSTPPVLLRASVTVPLGKLTVVIGPVASGKSSLVCAMLGEMQQISGHISHDGSHSMAVVPQLCWILNATVRENIVFGHPFDQSLYKKALTASGLEQDLTKFPGGDRCEIGEKGATMSGGQKQRIAIARALYADADIVFLDDCLSALDAAVGAHVFNKAVMKMLIGRGKTVVLVTHHVHLLPKADHLIVMTDQRVVYEGHPDAVTAAGMQPCTALLEKLETDGESRDAKLRQTGSQLQTALAESETILSESLSYASLISDKFGSNPKLASSQSLEASMRLVVEEQPASGSVPWSVYVAYMKAAAWVLCALTVLLFMLWEALKMSADYFLTEVVKKGTEIKSLEGYNDTTRIEAGWEEYEDFMMTYIKLSVICIMFIPISNMTLELMIIMASKNLHRKLIRSILSAPIKFFDCTPVGRILNRLSADMNVMDEKLSRSFEALLFCAAQVIGGIVMNSVFVPYFLIPIVPVFVVFCFVQRFFISSCRQFQRLECITRSPILAHISQMLNGLATIRAFRSQDRFVGECFEKIDANQLPYMFHQTTNIWMALRLDMLAACVVLAASLSALTSCIAGHIEPGMVGLVIAYAVMMSLFFNWMMRGVSETEIHFNSVQRIVQYCRLEREESSTGEEEDVEDSWPTCGDVQFKSVSLTYGSPLQAVVHDLSLHILPGQKVGICGRTGSGKSSLAMSLFSAVRVCAGEILLDGVNIGRVPLSRLRSSLSVIPQDPVLFSGTVRFNLDPRRAVDDRELWDVLEVAQLRQLVEDLPRQLDTPVTDAGDSYSVGQKQLFCLARALLRRSPVLVMDEATASVDVETDRIVHDIIQRQLADCTVFIIAHRLSTIRNCDVIVVMSDGRVVETGTPSQLSAHSDGHFAKILAENQL